MDDPTSFGGEKLFSGSDKITEADIEKTFSGKTQSLGAKRDKKLQKYFETRYSDPLEAMTKVMDEMEKNGCVSEKPGAPGGGGKKTSPSGASAVSVVGGVMTSLMVLLF